MFGIGAEPSSHDSSPHDQSPRQSPLPPDWNDDEGGDDRQRDDEEESFWSRHGNSVHHLVSYSEAEAQNEHGWEAEEQNFLELNKETLAVAQFSSSANLSLAQSNELIRLLTQVSDSLLNVYDIIIELLL
jgi:hypothetical protein